MATLPVRQLGQAGIITDAAPESLPPNAWSGGINVRFTSNKVQRAPIHRLMKSGLSATTPVFCYGLYTQDGYDSVIYCNNDGTIYQLSSGTETNITQSGHTPNVDQRPYTGC